MSNECTVSSTHIHVEVYFSINNENILELSKQMTTKSLGGFMASIKA